ncbi:M48 family metallopeptidase [bacterium]|nr:M48 family metallopeptidase [bacterium]
MNIYAIIILFALLLEFVLSLISDHFNLKALVGQLPDEFNGFYDKEKYLKSQEYTRTNTKFGFITSTFSLTIILIFWFSHGFNTLDKIVSNWKLGPIWDGLAYIGILILVKSILSLPFSIYSTFSIEERFGFNKTKPLTFIADILKSLVLVFLLGGLLLAGILAFFRYAGTLAWLYCWFLTTIFSLFLQFIAPTWIMPIFNKFKPLENGTLKESILNYARSVNYPLAGIFIMDGSKRSSKSNAFFTGFGKNKRIALYDTLVEKHTEPELVSILAHEIGHYKKKHILHTIMINILHMGIVFYLLSLFLSHEGLFQTFYMDNYPQYAGFLFFGMLYAPIEVILSILMNLVSRKNEYEADRFALKTTKNPEDLIHALKKLSANNLSNLLPHPFYVFINYSHPPVLQRIRTIRKLQKEKPLSY